MRRAHPGWHCSRSDSPALDVGPGAGARRRQPRPSRPCRRSAPTATRRRPAACRGYFDNVAFKSQAIQLTIDKASRDRPLRSRRRSRWSTPATTRSPSTCARSRKGHEARIEFVEKDGQKRATEIRFKGPIKIAKEDSSTTTRSRRSSSTQGTGANFVLIDSRPLPRFQQGTIPRSINLPYPGLRQGRRPPARGQGRADRVLLPGRHLHDEPAVAAQGEALGYTNVKVYREGMPEWRRSDTSCAAEVPEGGVHRQGHSARARRRAFGRGRQGGPHQGRGAHAGRRGEGRGEGFPDPKLKAPIIVYDGTGGPERDRGAAIDREPARRTCRCITGGLRRVAGRRAIRSRPARRRHQGRLRAEAAARLDRRSPSSRSSRAARRPTC